MITDFDLKCFYFDLINLQVCLEILEKGELQISDKERSTNLESSFKEIATIVSGKFSILLFSLCLSV